MQLCRQTQAAMHLFLSVLIVLGCPRAYSNTALQRVQKSLQLRCIRK